MRLSFGMNGRKWVLSLAALAASAVACGDDDEATGGGGGAGGGTVTTGAGGAGGAGGGTPDPLAYLAQKAGTYEGSWELFGIDAGGLPSLAFAWTDVAVADQPTVEATRAYLHVTDNLQFTFGFMGTQTQSWLEGVLILPDGKLGNQFLDQDGVVTELIEIEPNHFVYETELSTYDLGLVEGLTQQNLVEGHHTVDKLVTFPDGVETHTISRMTHVEYIDMMGQVVTRDWESLTGTHEKQD